MSQGARFAVVVGGDDLTESVCQNLRDGGWRVTVIWASDGAFRERIEACGATLLGRSPRDPESLRAAGIATAQAMLVLDQDDGANLEVALEAREANPRIRLVIRQFNQALARKIEENLPDCSVISLASHSAATYAAAAVDPSCFFGVEFPKGSQSLVGFSRRTAHEAGVVGCLIGEAESRLQCRVLSCNDAPCDPERPLCAADELVIFGPIEQLVRVGAPLQRRERGLGWAVTRARAIVSEFDPLLRLLLVAGAVIFTAATVYFKLVLNLDPVTAAYFVAATMTTVGYGDISLLHNGAFVQAIGIALMVAGLIIANLAIAFVAAALVRAQWNALQGMRPIRHFGHVVVFGAGRVGTRVVDFLTRLDAIVVMVELAPTPELIGRARARTISLLTGNGALDETLESANVRAARCAVVLTDNEATNLEIGLGARARRPDIPVIMRVSAQRFAASIRKQFEIRRAFSTTVLASPAFSDLAESNAARGRVTFAGQTYRLEERAHQEADPDAVTLAAGRADSRTRVVRNWGELGSDERALVATSCPR